MADHLHRQIREAMESKLTGLATTGTNVFANRLAALPEAKLPALRLFADREGAEALTVHRPTALQRTLEVVVECCAKAAGNLDDTLDLINKEVEVALSGGITVGGRTLDLTYLGMELDLEPGDKPVGVKRLRFSIPFTAMSNAPDTLT